MFDAPNPLTLGVQFRFDAAKRSQNFDDLAVEVFVFEARDIDNRTSSLTSTLSMTAIGNSAVDRHVEGYARRVRAQVRQCRAAPLSWSPRRLSRSWAD